MFSIDAEEHDFKILHSLDLNFYEPRLIIIEDETDHLNPSMNGVYQYLTNKGYVLEAFVLKNLYFKKD
jgi:hypothetical protein